jgi:hypothetical protein
VSTSELWTIGIAAYAAVVSTFVFGWDAYKWLASGAKIDMSVSINMKIIGEVEPDSKTYVSVTAYNVGDRPTTITNLGGMYFDTWWNAYVTKRQPKTAFIISQPSQAQRIPYRFDVGDQWMGLADQTGDILEMADKGYLFFILYTAQSGRGHRVRVKSQKLLKKL